MWQTLLDTSCNTTHIAHAKPLEYGGGMKRDQASMDFSTGDAAGTSFGAGSIERIGR